VAGKRQEACDQDESIQAFIISDHKTKSLSELNGSQQKNNYQIYHQNQKLH